MLPKMQTPSPLFPNSPSLIASEAVNEFTNHPDHDHQDRLFSRDSQQDGSQDHDFDEFTFACTNKDDHVLSLVTADEIFFNGQIKPTHPFLNTVRYREDPVMVSNCQVSTETAESCMDFGTSYTGNNRTKRLSLERLFIEEQFDDDMTELDGIPEGTYCVWKPRRTVNEESPAGRCKKSKSTRSWISKKWKFRDLLYRNYSESYKDMLVLLTPNISKKDAVTLDGGCGSDGDDKHNNSNKKNNQKVRIVGGGKSSVVFAV